MTDLGYRTGRLGVASSNLAAPTKEINYLDKYFVSKSSQKLLLGRTLEDKLPRGPAGWEFESLTAHHFCVLFVEVRIMPSLRYRKLAEDCLERAAQARKSEDSDAWLLIAKDWLLLAAEFDAADRPSGRSPQR
jgi:hypothetical protein